MRHKKFSSIGKDLTNDVYDPDEYIYITPKRRIDQLVLHCAATINTRPYNAFDIDEWHLDRGWSGIGYHYVVLLDGTIQKGRWVDYSGAHVKGHNSHTIGICYIGGLDQHRRPAYDAWSPEQKESTIRLITKLADGYGLDPYAGDLLGHNEFPRVYKDCPCINMNEFRKNFT
jgi:N-acetylmuramoyl-L-alanine amidase